MWETKFHTHINQLTRFQLRNTETDEYSYCHAINRLKASDKYVQ